MVPTKQKLATTNCIPLVNLMLSEVVYFVVISFMDKYMSICVMLSVCAETKGRFNELFLCFYPTF
jgi:biopolymer transport protein ExbD